MSGGGERRERGRELASGGGREGGEVGEAGGRKGGAPLRRSHGPANARRALSPELGGACERPFAAAAAAAAPPRHRPGFVQNHAPSAIPPPHPIIRSIPSF